MDMHKMGISGRAALSFLRSEITPLLALVGLLLGIFAVIVTPREEEPQINVTFANVFIPFPGASAREVEAAVTTPAEHIVSEIEGIKHVYSASQPGMAALTVQFKVGEPRTDAIVRLYNAFYANPEPFAPNLGVGQPIIKPKGIDDVPIVSLTLWSDDAAVDGNALRQLAKGLKNELQRVPGTREINTIGGSDTRVKVTLDPARLAGYQLSLDDLRLSLSSANASTDAGRLVRDNQEIIVQAGTFLTDPDAVGDLVIGLSNGAPIYLRDVASVDLSAQTHKQYVTHTPAAGDFTPAVTIAIGKKPGENAVDVANAIIARLDDMKGIYLPDNIQVDITRNYGASAEDKAQTLIKKLIFATLSVILLVLWALGKREALVVGAAVVVTLAITLFASWAWGFTLNRVSLFALIFSIGILVDDAIVVVENIHRHMSHGDKSLAESIPLAVDEVGGPTILATFTVIAALLPMAFVTGLMGPYMLPIPINASTGMLISLVVAFVFTPWMFMRLFKNDKHNAAHSGESKQQQRLNALFTRVLTPFLGGDNGGRARYGLLGVIMLLIAMSLLMVSQQAVIMKMLPFDNKSEFQVIVDMPEGTPLETTQAALQAMANDLRQLPELQSAQLYAGTASPINFNGLVRQYYLRSEPHQGDIQVNLLDKSERDRKSHAIALEARDLIQASAARFGANVKVVEMPPGPPVMAPLVAEIYGMDYAGQQQVAEHVATVFNNTADVVDVDTTIEAAQTRWTIVVDRDRANSLGLDQARIVNDIHTALRGSTLSYLHNDNRSELTPIVLSLSSSEKSDLLALQQLRIRGANGQLIPLANVTRVIEESRQQTIYHKDLQPVVYVMGDVAGGSDSPLYGLIDIAAALAEPLPDGSTLQSYYMDQPGNPYQWSMKWDGEWQVTFETFRDMGIAYSVGLIMIYLLVVAQFRSYSIPLIIMAPIPLTIIGIMPGHALLGQQFTAPSMIGMIALAGIIVRNSILLVDFIQQQIKAGHSIQQATIDAAAVRSLPIALTAVAAMMGGFFILDDPIFGGLAVSLIFGLLVSTVLTLVVIPVVYYHYHYRHFEE